MRRGEWGLVIGAALALLIYAAIIAPPLTAQIAAGTVNLGTLAKGLTASGKLTSTAVDANTQALDVILRGTGSAITIAGTISAVQGAAAAQSNRWPVYLSDGTFPLLGRQTAVRSLPVVIATDQGNVGTLTPLTLTATGQQAVTATATALPDNTARHVCIRVFDGGTQTVYFGVAGVTTTTGLQLLPNDSWCRPLANTNQIFLVAAATGSTVGFEAEQAMLPPLWLFLLSACIPWSIAKRGLRRLGAVIE